jgi:hypothetical protein
VVAQPIRRAPRTACPHELCVFSERAAFSTMARPLRGPYGSFATSASGVVWAADLTALEAAYRL